MLFSIRRTECEELKACCVCLGVRDPRPCIPRRSESPTSDGELVLDNHVWSGWGRGTLLRACLSSWVYRCQTRGFPEQLCLSQTSPPHFQSSLLSSAESLQDVGLEGTPESPSCLWSDSPGPSVLTWQNCMRTLISFLPPTNGKVFTGWNQSS